ncbi:hypothetical protein QBC33DRAFT_593245 [Phialemonium atrogriseum]|uniref:Uncharacterized protein n=1 Tax=Phialemonium atrogriseum TaxID=1093897 RepID=A0AAJ0BVG2_9PEZI|nr:uncharacterized protein QBC33DRAFT_593245 [Phialemonium atrogriseum]KAK1765219.1 hypothetical protein QBC33DRAFT_593245 [Phialemonium atrogriseum]
MTRPKRYRNRKVEHGTEKVIEARAAACVEAHASLVRAVGSGEKLMKNARAKDKLTNKYNVIDLKMEAAGTMNRIPVGVIPMAPACVKAVLNEISLRKQRRTCWKLEYRGLTLNILAVDRAKMDFDISLRAMDALTDGQSQMLGRIDVNAMKVPVAAYGI